MKKYILFFISLIFSVHAFPQKHVIDSLQRALAATVSDTDRLKVFTSLATTYYSVKTDSFFIYCNNGLELAKSLNSKKSLSVLSLKMASMLTDTGNYPLALKYAAQSLAIAQALNSKAILINSYAEIGRVYDFQSDFVRSSDYFFKAMAIAKEAGDHEKMALIGTNLSADFLNEGDYKKAEEYAWITLREAQTADIAVHIYKAYYLLGMIKASQKDNIAANNYYMKAVEICRQKSFVLNEAEVINDMAAVQPTNEKRLELLMQAREIYDSLSPSSFNSRINWQSLGDTYLDMFKAHSERKVLLQKAEQGLTFFHKKSKDANDAMSIEQALKSLSEVNELKGDYKKAYELSTQYHAINDSIFSQENKNKIASLESKREMDVKNKEIENKELQINNQHKQRVFFISALLLLATIGGLLYRQNTTRKRTNTTLLQLNKELDEANKLKAKFFGILSHDLRSPITSLINFIRLQKREPGLLSEQQVREGEQKITASAESVLDTMESMLLWSKSQMQQVKPRKKSVKIADLFSYLENMFAANEHILFDFYNEGNLSVETDEDYLKAIMQNLTSNAVNAVKDIDHAKIEWNAWGENGQIFLSVKDNGAGINPENIKALFDDTATGSVKQGLGLHIIRDLAKTINCKVYAVPGIGKGAGFVLSL